MNQHELIDGIDLPSYAPASESPVMTPIADAKLVEMLESARSYIGANGYDPDPEEIISLILELQSLRSVSGEVVPVGYFQDHPAGSWRQVPDQWADLPNTIPLYAHPVQGVGVKPLEWSDWDDLANSTFAETVIGRYFVVGAFSEHGDSWSFYVDDDEIDLADSEADAKVRAFSHYSRRILSALKE